MPAKLKCRRYSDAGPSLVGVVGRATYGGSRIPLCLLLTARRECSVERFTKSPAEAGLSVMSEIPTSGLISLRLLQLLDHGLRRVEVVERLHGCRA
jgi:hypothetical protein